MMTSKKAGIGSQDEKLERAKFSFSKNANKALNAMRDAVDEYSLHGGNTIATAAVTVLVLMATLLSEAIKNRIYEGLEWMFIVIIVAFFLSLASWAINYRLSISYDKKRWRELMSIKDEAMSMECMKDFEKVNKRLHESYNHPKLATSFFEFSQIILFFIGVGFLSVLIILGAYRF